MHTYFNTFAMYLVLLTCALYFSYNNINKQNCACIHTCVENFPNRILMASQTCRIFTVILVHSHVQEVYNQMQVMHELPFSEVSNLT